MAYASWITPSATSGSGNGSINISANSSNTGRTARATTVTFKAANVTDVVRNVVQNGKPETTAIQASAAAGKTGGTITLTGTSNSSKLTFSLGVGDLELTLPATYTANGVNVTNGAAISGDPGATSEYAFSIQFSVPENVSIDSLSRQIIVTDDGGTAHTCTITQAAGDAYLTVTPASIELPWDASTSGTFTVSSNTNWSVV